MSMKQAVIYPTTTGERFEFRGGNSKTKCLITQQNFGRQADKAVVLKLFEI